MRGRRLKLAMIAATIVALVCLLSFSRSATGPAVVTLKMIGTTTNEDQTFTVLELNNAGPAPIRYLGYGRGVPWYQCIFESGPGDMQWSPYWCGTGVEECVLKAGETVRLQVLSPNDPREYRVVIGYALPDPWKILRTILPEFIARRLPQPPEETVQSEIITRTGSP